MKIFITGASGFIGSHLVRLLMEKNHQVMILTRTDKPLIHMDKVQNRPERIIGTLEDTGLLEDSIRAFHPEVCIHLAWYAEPGKYLDSAQNIQSFTSSLTLFNILIKAGCRQIVAAGTCFEYDTAFGYLNEDTPTRPASLYAAAKLSCYLMGSQLAKSAGIPFAWGRIFYPYGPEEDQRRLVPAAIAALNQGIPFPATPGEQIRDYIHVADVAAAFCLLMEKQADGIFNVSTGSPVSVRQLLETLGRLMSRGNLIEPGALPYRNWEPPFICGNNTQLRNLGWNPCYSLKEGLSDTIEKTASMDIKGA